MEKFNNKIMIADAKGQDNLQHLLTMVCVHSVINTYNTNLEYSCLCHKCVLGTTLIQQQVVFFVTYKFQNLEKGAFKSNV